VRKTFPERWANWLTAYSKSDLSFQPAGDFKRVDLVASLREQLSYYPRRICFLLIKKEWREVFQTNPQMDDAEQKVLDEILFGDCKTQAERQVRWAELEHEQAQWELEVWQTQGIKEGKS
jgi:hypothetical protein